MVCNVMKMIVRLGLEQKYKEELEIVRTYFDLALKKQLETYSTLKHGTALWYTNVKPFAKLVLTMSDLEILMSAKGDHSGVMETVRAVSASSQTGLTLCARALQKASKSTLVDIANKVLKPLMPGDWTEAVVSKAKHDFMSEVARAGISTSTLPCPSAQVKYRGCSLDDVPVATPMNLFNTMLEGFLRGEAVAMGLLPSLWGEDSFVVGHASVCKSIEKGLLSQAQVSRKIATDYLIDNSPAGIMSVLDKKGKTILSKDPYFKVEMAFWSRFVGEGGHKHQEEVLKLCVDTIGGTADIATIHRNLLGLQKAGFMRLAVHGLQPVLEGAIEVAASLMNDCVPNFGRIGTTTLGAHIKAGFLATVKYQPTVGETLAGQEALEQILRDLSQKILLPATKKPPYVETLQLRQFMNFLDKLSYDVAAVIARHVWHKKHLL